MEYLYRIFFFVVSMTLLMVLTLPLVLITRFLLRKHRRKYIMWEWRLVYLRSICPFAMTSLLFVIPGLNHYYHLFLNRLGFTMQGVSGIMFHWSDIFKRHITVSITFKACSIIWAAGTAILLLHVVLTQRNLRTYFARAKMIGEDIYESSVIELPVQIGIFHKKIYLPRGFRAEETAWLLRHMESRTVEPIRRFIVVMITIIYWVNPVMWLYYYLWSTDNEILCDERIICSKPDKIRQQYAQGVLNFKKSQKYIKNEKGEITEKKTPNICSFLTIFERNTDSRSRRLMHQKWYNSGRGFSAFVCLCATCCLLFILSPIHQVWAGSTEMKTKNEDQSAKNLFENGKNIVVARATAKSPSGLQRVIQLEMRKGEEDGTTGYDGKFSLVMYDNINNKVDSMDMDDVFTRSVLKNYHFTRGMALQIQDYNADGIQEISLGQKQALTDAEFEKLFEGSDSKDKPKIQESQVYQFSLVNVEEEKLKLLQEGIISVSQERGQNESIQFGRTDGVDTVFSVPFGNSVQYYEWNVEGGSYEAKKYTAEDVQKLKENKKDNGSDVNQAQDHTLAKEDGSTAILVSTKRDSTTSEEIQSVTISPRNSEVQLRDIKGYYCDLLWVPGMGEEQERYAQLIYNGTKSRTFVVYDTKRKTVYYSQEDGTEELKAIFKQYNYNDDFASFKENGVIYSLQSKTNDTLKISFSAEAEGNVTLKGSYEYNVKEKKSANLSFTQIMNSQNSTAAPTVEPEAEK